MTKINLLHIVSTLQLGGAEKQVVTLLNHIDKKKYRVMLCCLHYGGQLEREIDSDKIKIFYLGFRIRHFAVSIFKLIRFMKNNNIHVVHTHLYSDHFWGRIAAFAAGVPVIVSTEHGRGLWKKTRHLLFERIANRHTDMRIAVSEDVRKIRIEREHTPPSKVVTIFNSINPNDFAVPDAAGDVKRKEFDIKGRDFIIGTVARLDPDKAIDVLFEALSIVSCKAERVRLLLVGDGPLRERLEIIARTMKIYDKVIFAGVRMDIADLLSVMDVYVNSSLREGLPVSLLEAMAAEKAVIVTDVGGNSEVVDDSSVGIVVPPDNAGAIAGAIMELYSNKELRRQLGRNARERIKNTFSINVQSRKVESLYEIILRDKGIL